MKPEEIEARLEALEFAAAASIALYATKRWSSSWLGGNLPELMRALAAAKGAPYPESPAACASLEKIFERAINLYPLGKPGIDAP